MDGIVYAVAAALGFATVENVLFALWRGEWVILSRAFTSTLAHVGLSGLVGYHLGLAKFRERGRLLLVLRALFVATVLHGFYDLALVWASHPDVPDWIGGITVGVMVPGLLVLLWWAMRLADRASPFRPSDADGPGATPGTERSG
jgi:RsiW-degrading membrane proteinase PrsW (M82 family)